ncbi:ABC transporter G family member 14-like isoform X2 [Dioscorea cayenensis subsp. rotundata]|uniref:ABC transporter G family member 14-like isoform X2 n=1 Tax=Dioscorea cayennensis subsp. rotundata TaxID=55577 RepID=A0AB40C8D6_DIOCR|nr:ABC transporter G family member 14-like isoform X2 [Dioscorea cayenensis subsp. rotundata]
MPPTQDHPTEPVVAYPSCVFPVTLKFEEVVYKVKVNSKQKGWTCCNSVQSEKTILNGISGMVCPGEILAMLGPSGSGKTTLLTALGGRLRGKLSGKITYNGQPFSSSMRRRTGFVLQDDVLYPHLTVSETLMYTALLRLPSSLTKDEKVQQAQRVMAELGLGGVANTMIGGPLFRGVSGGEKKRVSIGQEMLLNPSLLLVDEPTSGLDSTTAQRIMSTLRRLAVEGGLTVVTTIHQPSSRLYHMFHKVVLISEGCPMYYGPASSALDYLSSIGYSSPIVANPADVLLDLANGISPNNSNVEKEQNEQKMVKEELILAYDRNIASRLKMKREQWSTSWWEQFRVLLSRGLKERRYEAFNKLRIFQVLSVATVGGLLWWQTPPSHIQDRTSLLFFFSVFWGFYPLYNAVYTFPQERAMLIKEQSSGMYRLSSYFLARTVGDLPMELALPTAFVLIIYWMGGLKSDPATFILSLLVILYSVLVAQSLGLAVGAALMDIKQGTTMASVITLVFLAAGGYYVQQIPSFIAWFKYFSYSFYCFKLLLGIHYRADEFYECSPGIMCPVMEFPAIKAVGLAHIWADVCVMALMLIGYRLVAFLALHRLRLR